MWSRVLERFALLKALDRQFEAFGADTHRYEFGPCISHVELSRVEEGLQVELPESLKSFYVHIGNGGAGPCYGLNAATELTGYRPATDYPGVAVLRGLAEENDLESGQPDYFEIDHDHLSGLICVIHEGCGHEVCLVTSGRDVGSIVEVSNDGYVVEPGMTLPELYLKWLVDEIARFEAVKTMMLDGKSYDEIDEEMRQRFQDFSSGDRIASIANVSKPVELFGTPNAPCYHGASQDPWYRKILKNWQKKNSPFLWYRKILQNWQKKKP